MSLDQIERKSEKPTPVNNSWEAYLNSLNEQRESLRLVVEKHFPNRYLALETCLAVKALHLIEGITLPLFLILMGGPGSGKTTLLDMVYSGKDCYRSDSFTAKSFVTHVSSVPRDMLESIDLLPKIKDKTFLTPELAPMFSSRDDNLMEILGILTRVLDGKGLEKDSGVHGQRGYSGNYFFTWIGAVVEIPRRVWNLMGNLGPKMYFLRLPEESTTEKEKQQKIISNMRDSNYTAKLVEVKTQVDCLWKVVKSSPIMDRKIPWVEEKDDPKTMEWIVSIAQLLARMRGSLPTENTAGSSGSNYSYGIPIIEDPERASNVLYNLARGHAVLYGRNYLAKEDIGVVIPVAFSSAPRERVELIKALVENNGQLNTSQIMEKIGCSQDTALRKMRELELLAIVDRIKESTNTKPIFCVKLKEHFHWLLSDDFQKHWKLF